MGLESGTSIAALNALWPLGTDPRSQGDDHLRLIKSVLKNDVPSLTGAGSQDFAGPLEATPTISARRASGAPYFRLFREDNPSDAQAFGITISAEGALAFLPLDDQTGTPGAVAARVEKAGAATVDEQTVITREKGDARYVPWTGGTLTGALTAPSLSATGRGWTATLGDNNLSFDRTDGTVYFKTEFAGGDHTLINFQNEGATYARLGTEITQGASIITRQYADGRYTLVSSQRRLKEGVERDAPPDAFWTLQPAAFVWGGAMDAEDPRVGKPGYSLIAEEVEAVFPAAVTRDEEGEATGLELKALVAALYHEVCRLRGLAAGHGAAA